MVDTVNAIITAIYDILTTDSTLKSLCGGAVRLYFPMSATNPDFPYLNHNLKPGVVPEQWSIVNADYFLDIWDYSDTAARALSIRDRVITLLDQRTITTAGGEIVGGRLRFDNDGFRDTDLERLWHYAMVGTLRYARKAEIANILGR